MCETFFADQANSIQPTDISNLSFSTRDGPPVFHALSTSTSRLASMLLGEQPVRMFKPRLRDHSRFAVQYLGPFRYAMDIHCSLNSRFTRISICIDSLPCWNRTRLTRLSKYAHHFLFVCTAKSSCISQSLLSSLIVSITNSGLLLRRRMRGATSTLGVQSTPRGLQSNFPDENNTAIHCLDVLDSFAVEYEQVKVVVKLRRSKKDSSLAFVDRQVLEAQLATSLCKSEEWTVRGCPTWRNQIDMFVDHNTRTWFEETDRGCRSQCVGIDVVVDLCTTGQLGDHY